METLWRRSEKRQKNAKNMYEQENGIVVFNGIDITLLKSKEVQYRNVRTKFRQVQPQTSTRSSMTKNQLTKSR